MTPDGGMKPRVEEYPGTFDERGICQTVLCSHFTSIRVFEALTTQQIRSGSDVAEIVIICDSEPGGGRCAQPTHSPSTASFSVGPLTAGDAVAEIAIASHATQLPTFCIFNNCADADEDSVLPQYQTG